MTPNIETWLAELNLEKYAETFAKNEIDLDATRDLTERDLTELNIPIGPRKKLLRAIAELVDRL